MRSRAAFRMRAASERERGMKGRRAAHAQRSLAVIKLFTAQEHYFLSGSRSVLISEKLRACLVAAQIEIKRLRSMCQSETLLHSRRLIEKGAANSKAFTHLLMSHLHSSGGCVSLSGFWNIYNYFIPN